MTVHITKQSAQGDVLISSASIPLAHYPAPAKRALKQEPPDAQGRVVLAHGEVTGHAHAIHRGAVMFRETGSGSGGAPVLSVGSAGADLVHEEHGTHRFAPGDYRVIRQRELTDADEPIQVAD